MRIKYPNYQKLLASLPQVTIQSLLWWRVNSEKFFGVQFHPEVTHTENGKKIISNFIFLICKIKKNWSSKDQNIRLIKELKEQVGPNKVICALSGGVDSSVVAQLLNKAIGKKLYCIFVNTGLLRKNEETQVVNTFKKKLKN